MTKSVANLQYTVNDYINIIIFILKYIILPKKGNEIEKENGLLN